MSANIELDSETGQLKPSFVKTLSDKYHQQSASEAGEVNVTNAFQQCVNLKQRVRHGSLSHEGGRRKLNRKRGNQAQPLKRCSSAPGVMVRASTADGHLAVTTHPRSLLKLSYFMETQEPSQPQRAHTFPMRVTDDVEDENEGTEFTTTDATHATTTMLRQLCIDSQSQTNDIPNVARLLAVILGKCEKLSKGLERLIPLDNRKIAIKAIIKDMSQREAARIMPLKESKSTDRATRAASSGRFDEVQATTQTEEGPPNATEMVLEAINIRERLTDLVELALRATDPMIPGFSKDVARHIVEFLEDDDNLRACGIGKVEG